MHSGQPWVMDPGTYIRRPQVDIGPQVFGLAPQEQLPCLHLQRGEKAVQERARLALELW
jgi:hypothetical protein